MKKTLQLITVMLIVCMALPGAILAQSNPDTVTIRDLNTYPEGFLTSIDSIAQHPLRGSLVTFTAVITSDPRSSGLASFQAEAGTISRLHVFVVDTTAASEGRLGMAMQIVESDIAIYSQLEQRVRGDVATFTGRLSFFNEVAQFDLTEAPQLIGNVNSAFNPELARFAPLLDPLTVTPDRLNEVVNGGTGIQLRLENYTDYHAQRVRFENATLAFRSTGDRPSWGVAQNGSQVFNRDVSLRYRNDRDQYREGYNFRRATAVDVDNDGTDDFDADGDFTPPPPGSAVNVSGYLVLDGFQPAGAALTIEETIFTVSPMNDGVKWTGTGENLQKNINGVDGFEWPDDFETIGFPPTFSELTVTPDGAIAPEDEITISVVVTPAQQSTTIEGVQLEYTSSPTGTVEVAMQQEGTGSTYTATIPSNTFPDLTPVSFKIFADDSEGLTGEISGSFVIQSQEFNSIAAIQDPAGDPNGLSGFNGTEGLVMDITATVLADQENDGFVLIQESAQAFSGIFLELTSPGVSDLSRGDQINISQASIFESDIDETSITFLDDVDFTVLDQPNDQTDTLYVPLATQDITDTEGAQERYEGMMLKFDNVVVTTNQADGFGSFIGDFGEWEIGTPVGGVVPEPEAGLRVDDNLDVGNPTYGETLNEKVKPGAEITTILGTPAFSFSNPNLVLRGPDDVIADHWTFPTRTIVLGPPDDGASIDVDSDLLVEWEASEDIDGNEVSYIWALTTSSDTEVDNPLLMLNSDQNGSAPQITLPFSAVDNLLENNNVAVGESIDLIWTVGISDGIDTVQASTFNDNDVDLNVGEDGFTGVVNSITLTRAKFPEPVQSYHAD